MIILGVNQSHDAGAALIKDNKIVSVINEERLNGIKNYWGFPSKSIDLVLKESNVLPSEVDKVAVSNLSMVGGTEGSNPKDRMLNIYSKNQIELGKRLMYFASNFGFIETLTFSKLCLLIGRLRSISKIQDMKKYLKNIGIKAPVELVEHHHAHACTAFLTSPYKESLVYTSDFMGDFICGTVYECNEDGMKRIKEVPFYVSPGMVYGWITYYLGFVPGKHEGKITGLAAYGDSNKTYNQFADYLKLSENKGDYVRNIKRFWYLNAIERFSKDFNGISREHVAAGLQKRFEDVVSENVNYYVKKTNFRTVALAGGIFANVRLNQRILELETVDNVFIHPAMTDGGLALGAALALYEKDKKEHNEKLKSFNFENVYFGPQYSDHEIEEEIKKSKLNYEYVENIEKEAAELLSNKKIVARFNGRMEYGPRALGNRSILCHASDKTINDWLNKRLNRTDFMPFAPVSMEKFAKQSYQNLEGGEKAAKFMTMTFYVTDNFAKECPAVTHLDNTARPQIINENDNLSYYNILKEYHKITGIPTIINTSFNMHEWPIVCNPQNAIQSFTEGKLDYLAIGNYLLKN